jgi:hypothetical protein
MLPTATIADEQVACGVPITHVWSTGKTSIFSVTTLRQLIDLAQFEQASDENWQNSEKTVSKSHFCIVSIIHCVSITVKIIRPKKKKARDRSPVP